MKLRNVSASQVDTWNNCPRAWHFDKIGGFKTPPTKAMQRGTAIHSAIEYMVGHGGKVNGSDIYSPYAEATKPYLPIGQERVLVEYRFSLDTGPGLPPWIGFIDLVDDSRTLTKLLRITDHKTSSDFRYAKTPQELSENTQVNSYAKQIFEAGHDEDTLETGHLYIHTTGDKIPKKKLPRVLPVYTEVSRAHVEKVWARDIEAVEAMVRAAEITNTDLLPPKGTTNGQCRKYGGCPHRQRCGISPLATFGKKATPDMASFMERVAAANAAKNAAAAGAPAAEAPAAEAKPATEKKGFKGVLPPDAPSRTTPIKAKVATAEPEEDDNVDHAIPTGAAEAGTSGGTAATTDDDDDAELAAAMAIVAAKKAKKAAEAKAAEEAAALAFAAKAKKAADAKEAKEAEEAEAAAKAAVEAEATAKAPKAVKPSKRKIAEHPGFAVYIDCMPTKDNAATQAPMLFEDWFAPVRQMLNEEALASKGLTDYILLPYAEAKAMFAIAINSAIEAGLPQVMIVSSSTPNARDALDVLVPHATLVVRSVRG